MAAGDEGGSSGPSNNGGCILGIICAVVIGIAAISNSGTSRHSDTANSDALSTNTQTFAVAPSAPPPPQPLSLASVRAGSKHFGMTLAAGGSAGMMVYSQNCFDALARQFSWSKLDECGAFDQHASDALADEVGSEATYFDRETAAGRYLAAATKAGQDTSEADQRFADLQGRVAKLAAATHKPKIAPADLTLEAPDPDAISNASDLEGSAEETNPETTDPID